MFITRLSILGLKLAASLWLLISAQASATENTSEVDSLLRVNKEEMKEVRDALTQLLFLTPANCGRMLVRPSSAPEHAVAVYSRHNSAYYVSATAASTSVWLALDKRQQAISEIKVKRWDARIPPSTALAIKSLWKSSLDHVGDTNLAPYSLEPLDATIVEFSLRAKGQRRVGELPPEPGKHMTDLEQIGLLLSEYAKSPKAQRSLLAEKIERDANELLKQMRERKREDVSL